MYLLLSDIADYLLNPFSWALLLFLLAFFFRKRKGGKLILGLGTGVLFLFSNTFITDEAVRAWEEKGSTTLKSRIVVILGGGIVAKDASDGSLLFRGGSNRILQALELNASYPLTHIILSGGSGDRRDPESREASLMLPLLQGLDLVPEIVAEDSSRNTFENALNTAALLRSRQIGDTIVLISSAMHLPRAMACFRKQGLFPEPCAVGRNAGPRRWELLLSFRAANFGLWQELFHEISGLFYYKLSGKA